MKVFFLSFFLNLEYDKNIATHASLTVRTLVSVLCAETPVKDCVFKPRGGQSIFSFACFAYCQVIYFSHFCFGGSDSNLFKLIFKQKMACNVGNVGLQPVIDDFCFVPIIFSWLSGRKLSRSTRTLTSKNQAIGIFGDNGLIESYVVLGTYLCYTNFWSHHNMVDTNLYCNSN